MKRILILTVALSLLIVGAGFAQPCDFHQGKKMGPGGPGMMGCGEHGMMGQGPMKGFMKGLDLTEEQEAKLEKISRDHQRAMLELQTESAGTESKVKLLLTADKFDKDKAKALATKMGELNTKRMMMRFEHVRTIRDMLTPGQQIKFDKKVMSADGPGKGGMGMGGKKGMHRRD